MSELVKVVRPRTVDSLFKVLSNAYGDGRLIFRGQGDKSWDLISSFDRIHGGTHINREQDFERLLLEYKDLIERHNDIQLSDSANDIASFGQHYGLPTRLLDWSFSPYIGLFFCIDEICVSGKADAALYSIDRFLLEKVVSDNMLEFIDPDARYNSNLVRQQGCFSRIKTQHKHLVEFFESMQSELPDDFFIAKHVIKASWLPEIWQRLNAMNLHHIGLLDGRESVSKKLRTDIIFSRFSFS